MDKALSVTQLNSYINSLVSDDEFLSSLYVEGEISNFTHHYSGHLYFSIKDDKASIRCVMFAGNTRNLDFKPADGTKVYIYGYLSFYEKTGQCQINVTAMKKAGTGDLYYQFEQLKKKLQEQGLFSEQVKKPLPYLPEKIGLITSSTGAVLHDIQNTLKSRFDNYGMVLYPATVQGKDAHKTIIAGLEYFNKSTDVDVIIIARGGGSVEDLWPFNEEQLAYAIFESKIPVVSAIGHETDFTIADFVADVRAATPTAAAQIVMPEKASLVRDIFLKSDSLDNSFSKMIKQLNDKVDGLCQRPVIKRPQEYVNVLGQNLDNMTDRFFMASNYYVDNIMMKFNTLSAKLEALSPLNVLNRGYSITTDKTGKVIKAGMGVGQGDIIFTRTADLNIESKVEKVINNE